MISLETQLANEILIDLNWIFEFRAVLLNELILRLTCYFSLKSFINEFYAVELIDCNNWIDFCP